MFRKKWVCVANAEYVACVSGVGVCTIFRYVDIFSFFWPLCHSSIKMYDLRRFLWHENTCKIYGLKLWNISLNTDVHDDYIEAHSYQPMLQVN